METAIYYPNRKDLTRLNAHNYFVEIREINPKDFVLVMLIILTFMQSIPSPFTKMKENFSIDNNLQLNEVKASLPLSFFNTERDFSISENYYLTQKQLIISKYLIDNGVASPCFLEEEIVSDMHKKITALFEKRLTSNSFIDSEKIAFLIEGKENLIDIALKTQHKYHIPASVLLAKAILQSQWGKLVFENNLFQTIENNDLNSYKNVETAFEAVATNISQNTEFASLFVGGKDYKSWANKLGSIVCNDHLFSFSPDCHNNIEDIITTYQLNLLDF